MSSRVPIIGILGGIGSGKSAVADALQAFLKVYRLDADRAGHQALLDPQVKQALGTAFGPEIFDAQGNIVRAAIAQRVFGKGTQEEQNRKVLEGIVHPIIHRDLEQQLLTATSENYDVILLDAALLLEAGWNTMCSAIVFLDVPEETRIARVAGRGWSPEDLRRREASQLPLSVKRARADVVIDNSQKLSVAAEQLANWITEKFPISVESTQSHHE